MGKNVPPPPWIFPRYRLRKILVNLLFLPRQQRLPRQLIPWPLDLLKCRIHQIHQVYIVGLNNNYISDQPVSQSLVFQGFQSTTPQPRHPIPMPHILSRTFYPISQPCIQRVFSSTSEQQRNPTSVPKKNSSSRHLPCGTVSGAEYTE